MSVDGNGGHAVLREPVPVSHGLVPGSLLSESIDLRPMSDPLLAVVLVAAILRRPPSMTRRVRRPRRGAGRR